MFLELRNIRKVFGEKVAVDNLSLEVPKGMIYGVIGPNGAGKTTTIRMIMDITRPDSGEVLLEGKPVDRDFKNRVGYLPEERGLYKKMTLAEVMVYMGELKGQSADSIRPKLDPWLERMDLLGYKNRKVEELSKGMAQKLQFITTIIHDPDIIILDEIFSGLDPLNMELIKGILMDLKREGRTILFSTHVMEQAEKLCDHVCMISQGKKVIDGRLTDVKAQFGKNSVHVQVEGDGRFIEGLPGVKAIIEFNNYFELRIEEKADTNVILKAIVDRVRVLRFDLVEPSLYDIFIDVAKVHPSDLGESKGGGRV
jgi:ABC-2 type transport system ATP-binding protein